MKRSPMPGRSKPMRRRSSKKAAADIGYEAARGLVRDRSDGRCEAQIRGVCTHVGTMAHHVQRRSQGVNHDPLNLVWICGACHDYVHGNVAWAKSKGLLA